MRISIINCVQYWILLQRFSLAQRPVSRVSHRCPIVPHVVNANTCIVERMYALEMCRSTSGKLLVFSLPPGSIPSLKRKRRIVFSPLLLNVRPVAAKITTSAGGRARTMTVGTHDMSFPPCKCLYKTYFFSPPPQSPSIFCWPGSRPSACTVALLRPHSLPNGGHHPKKSGGGGGGTKNTPGGRKKKRRRPWGRLMCLIAPGATGGPKKRLLGQDTPVNYFVPLISRRDNEAVYLLIKRVQPSGAEQGPISRLEWKSCFHRDGGGRGRIEFISIDLDIVYLHAILK